MQLEIVTILGPIGWHRQTEQRARNFRFFDAPIGMFLQSVALAARSVGLHTCTQASIAEFPDVLRRESRLSDDEMPLCGMSVGHADPDAAVNHFRPHRETVGEFTRLYD